MKEISQVTSDNKHVEEYLYNEKNPYFQMNGYINSFFQDKEGKHIYPACPSENCKWKVTYLPGMNKYRCEGCDTEYTNCVPTF